jgi:hypothetical protein
MIPKNWSIILLKPRPRMYRKAATIIHLYRLRIACRLTITGEQKARNKCQRAMSRTGVGREIFLHAQVQASVPFCHRRRLGFPTTTKTMEARHPPETTMAKRYQGRWVHVEASNSKDPGIPGAPLGKLANARKQLRLLLGGPGRRGYRKSRSLFPPSP